MKVAAPPPLSQGTLETTTGLSLFLTYGPNVKAGHPLQGGPLPVTAGGFVMLVTLSEWSAYRALCDSECQTKEVTPC